jgi:hypothetical protein
MLGSFNHNFQGLKPRKSGPASVNVENWCTNDEYGQVLTLKCCYNFGRVHVCAAVSAPLLLFALGLKAISLKGTITGNALAIDQHQLC